RSVRADRRRAGPLQGRLEAAARRARAGGLFRRRLVGVPHRRGRGALRHQRVARPRAAVVGERTMRILAMIVVAALAAPAWATPLGAELARARAAHPEAFGAVEAMRAKVLAAPP